MPFNTCLRRYVVGIGVANRGNRQVVTNYRGHSNNIYIYNKAEHEYVTVSIILITNLHI